MTRSSLARVPTTRRWHVDRLRTVVAWLIVGCGLAVTAPAQTWDRTASGRVVTPRGEPLEGCEVALVGRPDPVACTAGGRFEITGIPVAGGVLVIRRIGYRPELIRVSPNDPVTGIDVVLWPGPHELPDLEVKARFATPARYLGRAQYEGFFHRRRLGLGTFLTREELAARPALRTVELLQGIPGIRITVRPPGHVEGTHIRMARCGGYPPRINVYIDGVKLQPEGGIKPGVGWAPQLNESPEMVAFRRRVMGQTAEMLDRVDPRGVELIEVYRGVGQLPAEFHDDNCAAIVIWTR